MQMIPMSDEAIRAGVDTFLSVIAPEAMSHQATDAGVLAAIAWLTFELANMSDDDQHQFPIITTLVILGNEAERRGLIEVAD